MVCINPKTKYVDNHGTFHVFWFGFVLYTKKTQIKFPTIVPFPVGTGNDLSRSLGWGNIERTPDKIIKHVADVEYCFNISKRFSVLDRWGCTYNFKHITDEWNKLKQNKYDESVHSRHSGEEFKEFVSFESEQAMLDNYVNSTFSPPLPKGFLCYLSFGYDAMITYNFAMERKNHPEKFKSQLSNQTVYLKMGVKELMSPSAPVNGSVIMEIDGKETQIPQDTRSLKLVNINSAASGIFFWGYNKSRKDELQYWKKPQLNDGLIEVMASRGSTDLAMAKTHLSHAHRIAQANDIKFTVVKTPVYLQIDGEGWRIDKPMTLHVKLYDQLPTLIGYKFPRGVYHKYESDYYTDKIKKARHRFRKTVRMKYNIPKRMSKDYNPNKPNLKKRRSTDDFELKISRQNSLRDDEETKIQEIKELEHNDDMNRAKTEGNKPNEINEYSPKEDLGKKKKKKRKSWRPLFGNIDWKRNKSDKKNKYTSNQTESDKNVDDKNKKPHRRGMSSWF